MSTDAESVAYTTQIVPSFCNTPKCIVKKQYKMSTDGESVAYTTQIVPSFCDTPKCIVKNNTKLALMPKVLHIPHRLRGCWLRAPI